MENLKNMRKSAIMVSGIIGSILVVYSGVNYLASGFWDVPAIVILLIGILLSAVYVVYNFQKIKNLTGRRVTHYVSNALISSLFAVGIVILMNYVFNKHSVRVDLTANKQYTLADQTVKILKNLDKDVKITAFSHSTEKGLYEDTVAEYRHYSDKIKFAFFDPDKNPEIANNFGVKSYNTIFLETEGRSEKIISLDEQTLTNALIKVTRIGKKVIYFMTGHGEHDIEDFANRGSSVLKDRLTELNYEVKSINLAREKSIPEDCASLVVNGPQTVLFSAELDSIDGYINGGGKVFFLLDPDPAPGMPEYFDKWGLTVGNDLIIDYSGVGQLFGYGATVPLVTDYNTVNPIVEKFSFSTFFSRVRSVTPKTEGLPEGGSVEWLCKTTEQSWGETDFKAGARNKDKPFQVAFDDGKDLQGPVTIAAVVTKSVTGPPGIADASKTGELIVFGDSDFTTNAYSQTPNSTLFLNALNWLAEEDDLVAIPPKSPEDRRIEMTAKQAKFALYLTVFILPGIIISLGLSVFFRRRGL